MGWHIIQSQTLSSSVSSITFSNIPQTYKTLILTISCRRDSSAGSAQIIVAPNGLTTSILSRQISGNGTAASSTTSTSMTIGAGQNASDTINTYSNSTAYFPNYSSSSLNKPISAEWIQENNTTTAYLALENGLWSSSAAITSLVLSVVGGGNFIFGSTFTLHGLI